MIFELAEQLYDQLRLTRKGMVMSQLVTIIGIVIAFAVLLGVFIFLTQDKGSEATEATTSLMDKISGK